MKIEKASANWNRVNTYFYGDGEVEVGSFAIHHNPYTAEWSIWSVEIFEQYQGLGHGREMMQLALAELRALAAPCAHLYVKAKNTKAIRLYESLGFTTTAAMGNRGDLRMEVVL